MAKLFFEVFPTLKITGEMSALLKETEITKVASNSAQNALRIYLESTRLIPKPEIYHIEPVSYTHLTLPTKRIV